ncbi:MAG: hypothetical protein ACTSUG_12705, partial [Candidatus Helarchaeota archaeon]
MIVLFLNFYYFNFNLIINAFLGVICILFLPGYNLLEIIKPKSTTMEKIGYIPIVSISIENILMFINYLMVFNNYTYPENDPDVIFIGFKYDGWILIVLIQILNIILIVWKFKNYCKVKKKYNNDPKLKKKIKELVIKNFNLKIIFSFIGYFYSILFLCLST